MIISTISWGSLVAEDEGVVEVPGEPPPEHILRTLAIVRYRTRLMSSSNTVTAIVVRRSDKEWVTWLLDNADVGVFVGGIVSLLQTQSSTFRAQMRLPWENPPGTDGRSSYLPPSHRLLPWMAEGPSYQ